MVQIPGQFELNFCFRGDKVAMQFGIQRDGVGSSFVPHNKTTVGVTLDTVDREFTKCKLEPHIYIFLISMSWCRLRMKNVGKYNGNSTCIHLVATYRNIYM